MRFLTLTALIAVVCERFLVWAQGQSDRRIRRMQQAAFDSPGAESPLPVPVLLTAAGLLLSFLWAGRFAGLGRGSRTVATVVGSAAGVALHLRTLLFSA